MPAIVGTEVFVNVNGMVQHRHEGAKGWGKKNWHDPAKKHEGALHEEADAGNPTNASLLTADQMVQYQAALSGQSWMTSNLAQSRTRRIEAGIAICDARCWNAEPGGSCDCECGGANHGMAFTGERAPVAKPEVAPALVVAAPPVKERRTGPRELILA